MQKSKTGSAFGGGGWLRISFLLFQSNLVPK